jgi:ribulose kinase
MNEGGQSSTGQLIDFVMSTHPAYPKLLAEAEKTGKNPFTLLGERLDRMRIEKGLETASMSLTFILRSMIKSVKLTDSSIDQGLALLS